MDVAEQGILVQCLLNPIKNDVISPRSGHARQGALAKDAALPPAVARLTAQDIELRGGMVIDCRVQRGEGAAVGEVTVDLLTVDAMGEP